jgi:arylsulfatase A-like enzyme
MDQVRTDTGTAALENDLPSNVVVVLMDSLNRHLIGPYGATEFDTPNLDRFARRSARFEQHYTGSLPCIPARHDLLVGTQDFLWRPWGSIEIWETAITTLLREQTVVTSMLVSDHPHLFEVGGENYHVDFTAWDYQRGGKGDPWKTRPDPSWAGAPETFDRGWTEYDDSRGWFRGAEDFPGSRTMQNAADWLRHDAPHADRFFLFVDEFDPHEPFDAPEPYASMYDPDWEGGNLIWPPYARRARERGVLTDRQAVQIRAMYGAKVTMIDDWFGRILDVLDEAGAWEDTAVFVLSDHGIYLGERDMWGKPPSPGYEQMTHIPLLVHWPGREPGSVPALTTAVDVHATIAEIFGVEVPHRTHGRSLVPVLNGEASAVRDHVLCGVWGREVHVMTGRHKYVRSSNADNAPLSMWSNRWSTQPVRSSPTRGPLPREFILPPPNDKAYLDRMPDSAVPVIRQPYGPGDPRPFWAYGEPFGGHLCFDLAEDPEETRNLADERAGAEGEELLREALVAVDAPDDQFARLGLA